MQDKILEIMNEAEWDIETYSTEDLFVPLILTLSIFGIFVGVWLIC